MSSSSISTNSKGGPTTTSDGSSPGFFMKSTIASIKLKFPSVRLVTTRELRKWMEEPSERTVALLDSRPIEEYAVSHIDAAIRVDFDNTNLGELLSDLQVQLNGKPQPTIVCYCSIGYRSSLLASNLQNYMKESGTASPPEVYSLAGSLFQWANEGRPMVDMNGQPTPFAHPYNSLWGKLLNSSLRKSTSVSYEQTDPVLSLDGMGKVL